MTVSGLLLADFTVEPLANALSLDESNPKVVTAAGPFGQVMDCLHSPSHPCWNTKPDFTLIWTRPEGISSSFAAMLGGADSNSADLDADVDAFAAAIIAAKPRTGTLFIASWCLPLWRRSHGIGALKPSGIAYALLKMNLRLIDQLQAHAGIHVLDAARWSGCDGLAGVDAKTWYLGKIPFSRNAFSAAVFDVKAALRGTLGMTRKVLILDLDDTLWGGTVGEDGAANLRIGGHDAVGEAIVDFQKGVKALERRGIMLALVSKNTEAVALDVIDNHPEMVLRRRDFVGWRINWQDKAANIRDLVAELNVGLDSVVFIDNDAAERERVRQALPAVLVPDWPGSKLLYPFALESLDCFEFAEISEEDRNRSSLYQQERVRRENFDAGLDRAEWLASTGLSLELAPLSPITTKRAVQLLNKTNQMNLSTRRMPEAEFLAWAARPDTEIVVASVRDRFGSYGITGLSSIEVLEGGTARMVDYLLSCRVLGRGVEQALLAATADAARRRGARRLDITLHPTDRNQPCALFLAGEAALECYSQFHFSLDLTAPYCPPDYIAITEATELESI